MQIERTFQHYDPRTQFMFEKLWLDRSIGDRNTWFIKCLPWELDDMRALVYALGGTPSNIKFNSLDFTQDGCPEFYAVIP